VRYLILTSFIAVTAGQIAVLPTPSLTERVELARRVLSTLKAAVAAKDPYPITRMIKFPLNVRLREGSVQIRDESEFVKLYPRLFHADMRASVLCQEPEKLVVAQEGMAIGGGEIWFRFHEAAGDKSLSATIMTINADLAFPRSLRGNIPCAISND
jgi:hypothetical protein